MGCLYFQFEFDSMLVVNETMVGWQVLVAELPNLLPGALPLRGSFGTAILGRFAR